MRESVQHRTFFGSLESLRGVAALLVALYHAAWLHPFYDAGIVRNSYLMVDLFFVLSGFVMCHGYGSRMRSRAGFRDFFVLRFGRLYPLHIATLSLFVAREVARYAVETRHGVVNGIAFTRNNGWALLSNTLLAQSLNLHNRLTFNDPSWSISAEFFTYLVFGGVVIALSRRTAGVRGLFFALISGTSFGALWSIGRGDLNFTYDWGWLRCFMGFFLGAAIYVVYAGWLRRSVVQRVAPYAAAGGLAAAIVFLELKTMGLDDFWVPPLAGLIVVSLALSPQGRLTEWLQSRPLAYLGRVSYSIYMVHFGLATLTAGILASVFRIGSEVTPSGAEIVATSRTVGLISLFVYLTAVLVISQVTFRLIEEPFRRRAKAWVAMHGATADARALSGPERLRLADR